MVTFHLLKCLTVSRPQKSLGVVRSTALWTIATRERPLFSGVPAVCCACCPGKAAGTALGMLRLQVLVDTLTSQFCSRGDRWAALTHGFPRSRLQLIYLPVHSPTNGFVEHLLSGSSV